METTGRCVGRKCGVAFKPQPFSTARYQESTCDRACAEGSHLCKMCVIAEQKHLIGANKGTWHGIMGGPLMAKSHIAGSEWAMAENAKNAARLAREAAGAAAAAGGGGDAKVAAKAATAAEREAKKAKAAAAKVEVAQKKAATEAKKAQAAAAAATRKATPARRRKTVRRKTSSNSSSNSSGSSSSSSNSNRRSSTPRNNRGRFASRSPNRKMYLPASASSAGPARPRFSEAWGGSPNTNKQQPMMKFEPVFNAPNLN